jgi:cytosolic carboxypeptidase protein 5
VAIFKATGVAHVYTVEVNYNTGRVVNAVPPTAGGGGGGSEVDGGVDGKLCAGEPAKGVPPKFTPATWRDIGKVSREGGGVISKAIGVSVLDLWEGHPFSRVPNSNFKDVGGLMTSMRTRLLTNEYGRGGGDLIGVVRIGSRLRRR